MREILPKLWIGTARDARDIRRVLNSGITLVVDLALEEPPLAGTRDIAYCRFPLIDGAGNPPWIIRGAFRAVAEAVAANVPTLVACSGGMSRSPAIVAAALSHTLQVPLEETLQRVAATGPCDVLPGLWLDVCQIASPEVCRGGP